MGAGTGLAQQGVTETGAGPGQKAQLKRPPANKHPHSPTFSKVSQERKGPRDRRDQPKSCTSI